MTDRRDLDYVDLRLDQRNPRHEAVQTQREAILALLANPIDRDKIVNLAKHMGSHGPSPIDSLIVLEDGAVFVVIEGNRRTAALKLLHNPELAQDPGLAKRFRQMAANLDVVPTSLNAVVLPTRDDAREWQLLRHDGEGKGAGVVNWSPEAKQRFNRKPGTHADRGLIVLDAMEGAYADDKGLMEIIKRVKDSKLTTFGRIMSDPYIRERFGIEIDQGTLFRHYPESSLKPPLKKVVADLDSTLTVSQVKTKEQRRQYVAGIASELPDEGDYSATREPFGDGQSTKKSKKKKGGKSKPKLFDNLSLTNAPQRVQDLVTEIRKLDPNTYPNGAALLIRGVVELMVGEAIAEQKWSNSSYLKDRIQECLNHIDPKKKDDKYQAVRLGLADQNHLMSAKTMNAWVHNVHLTPTAPELITITNNWTPFVQALDALL